jgi:F-type H+-transporting ATPase subunit delta
MARSAYARRYARAIYEIALENNELESWREKLGRIGSILAIEGVREALENPKISLEKRVKFLDKHLPEAGKQGLNLVKLLVSQERLEGFESIAAEYRRLVNRHQGIQQAEVSTAVPLDDTEKEGIAGKLAALLGTKVTVEAKVEPALIGGFVARIDGKLLDASTRRNLMDLKKELVGLGEKR